MSVYKAQTEISFSFKLCDFYIGIFEFTIPDSENWGFEISGSNFSITSYKIQIDCDWYEIKHFLVQFGNYMLFNPLSKYI